MSHWTGVRFIWWHILRRSGVIVWSTWVIDTETGRVTRAE